MADLLQELNERVKALAGDWTKYTVIGSFLLYLAGYLALRFHLTTIGIGTDLAVLDERYAFTGARFLVYFASSVPIVVLVALPVVALAWAISRLLPAKLVAKISFERMPPLRLVLAGIVFSVLVIQVVMRKCFYASDLLLARSLPAEPAWLTDLLLNDENMLLFFSALIASCAVPVAILLALRGTAMASRTGHFARGLLGFLAAVQLLFLPVIFGILIVDKSFARVASLGGTPLESGGQAWLAWDGKEGVTFLLRSQDRSRRSLLTLPHSAVQKMEIIGFDRIVPTLFGPQQRSTP